jgi:Sulfotransferase family
MPQILYISGSGRSGSTLLERLIHSSERAFATGELHVLWRMPPEAITCACGARIRDCDAWRRILGRFAPGAGGLAELAHLEAEVSRTGFVRRHGFDPERIAVDLRARRFLDLQRALFGAIAAATGREIVVDSSKAGPRAALLACLQRTAIIHIWRDPVDVIASWRSRKFDAGLGAPMQRLPVLRAAEDWLKSEFIARRIARNRPVAFVDYGEFCAAPRATLAAIAGRLDVRLDDLAWRGAARFEPGGFYHSLGGNPDRFVRGPVDIVPRAVDRSTLSPADRVAATLLGAAARTIFPAE